MKKLLFILCALAITFIYAREDQNTTYNDDSVEANVESLDRPSRENRQEFREAKRTQRRQVRQQRRTERREQRQERRQNRRENRTSK